MLNILELDHLHEVGGSLPPPRIEARVTEGGPVPRRVDLVVAPKHLDLLVHRDEALDLTETELERQVVGVLRIWNDSHSPNRVGEQHGVVAIAARHNLENHYSVLRDTYHPLGRHCLGLLSQSCSFVQFRQKYKL